MTVFEISTAETDESECSEPERAISRSKTEAAANATDIVVAKFIEAGNQLDYCWTNGYGVLSDSNETRRRLIAAKIAIEVALAEIQRTEWPTRDSYDRY